MSEWLSQIDPDVRAALWVCSIGAMTNAACAMVGCYLVLRRMSLLGDALSHAVLPGLVVAFVLGGSLNILAMFAGALVVGILTTGLTEALHRKGGVPADAALGVVFTSLFALGVVLIKRYGQGVHLDVDCVLQGQIEFVDLHHVQVGGLSLPRTAVTIAPVLILDLLFVLVLWKELKIASFDPQLADSMGISSNLVHYALMAMAALTTVASFEAVGSILVIAMLIVPGATAHLLTDRLGRMLAIAVGLAVASAWLGYAAALWIDANVAGMMAVVVGLFYGTAALLAPRYGIVARLARNVQTSRRIVAEDLLAMLYRLEELTVPRTLSARQAREAVGGGWLAAWALWNERRHGHIVRHDAGLRLSAAGRQRAVSLVRSHRLWEAWLVENLGLPPDHVHAPAERMEHFIDQRMQAALTANLTDAHKDPHGREIPAGEPRE